MRHVSSIFIIFLEAATLLLGISGFLEGDLILGFTALVSCIIYILLITDRLLEEKYALKILTSTVIAAAGFLVISLK